MCEWPLKSIGEGSRERVVDKTNSLIWRAAIDQWSGDIEPTSRAIREWVLWRATTLTLNLKSGRGWGVSVRPETETETAVWQMAEDPSGGSARPWPATSFVCVRTLRQRANARPRECQSQNRTANRGTWQRDGDRPTVRRRGREPEMTKELVIATKVLFQSSITFSFTFQTQHLITLNPLAMIQNGKPGGREKIIVEKPPSTDVDEWWSEHRFSGSSGSLVARGAKSPRKLDSTCAVMWSLGGAVFNIAVERPFPRVRDLRGGTRLHSRVGRHVGSAVVVRAVIPRWSLLRGARAHASPRWGVDKERATSLALSHRERNWPSSQGRLRRSTPSARDDTTPPRTHTQPHARLTKHWRPVSPTRRRCYSPTRRLRKRDPTAPVDAS